MIEYLPHVNATLNSLAAVLLVMGYVLIRRQRESAHKKFMVSAFGVSTLFLISYVVYHANAGSRPFPRDDYALAFAIVYYAILVTHVILAALVPFLAGGTIVLGLLDRRLAHRKLARWTFPIWLYVSATGVLVYLMLYWMFLPKAT